MNMNDIESELKSLSDSEFTKRWNQVIDKGEALNESLTNENAHEVLGALAAVDEMLDAFRNEMSRRAGNAVARAMAV